MRRPMWLRAGLLPALALLAIVLWSGRPAVIPAPPTIAMQPTPIGAPPATVALQNRVDATPQATPAASPAPVSSPSALPEDITFRGSGDGVTDRLRMDRGPVGVVVAYHGDGSLIVWLEHPAGERRPLIDEIGPWDGEVGIAIDDPGDYRFAVEADGGPWTIAIERSREGSG